MSEIANPLIETLSQVILDVPASSGWITTHPEVIPKTGCNVRVDDHTRIWPSGRASHHFDVRHLEILIHCVVPGPDRWMRLCMPVSTRRSALPGDQAHHTGQYHRITNRYAVKKSLEDPAYEGDTAKPENRTAAY